eukprot:CAMPEP_0197910560 /NCGR_PEP_ID=MMETSP1439-20131203/71122_1 /TAXON_ID=66791 /ORGANISM="Gonyaulax spinifera, Strain CCMP409" /LENGTH=122 /DNA_ID=CAMNT_0043532227 /DNA_START=13 /DNA_END=377 /DNA_ORIENTATION=-
MTLLLLLNVACNMPSLEASRFDPSFVGEVPEVVYDRVVLCGKCTSQLLLFHAESNFLLAPVPATSCSQRCRRLVPAECILPNLRHVEVLPEQHRSELGGQPAEHSLRVIRCDASHGQLQDLG